MSLGLDIAFLEQSLRKIHMANSLHSREHRHHAPRLVAKQMRH